MCIQVYRLLLVHHPLTISDLFFSDDVVNNVVVVSIGFVDEARIFYTHSSLNATT